MTKTVRTSLHFRKWFLDVDIVPEDVKPGIRPSKQLLVNTPDPGSVKSSYTEKFDIPAIEFLEILSALPDFNTLPVFDDMWNDAKNPMSFVVYCEELSDQLFVDTSGYEYPRYKAFVYQDES
jgi:hypothetical protein